MQIRCALSAEHAQLVYALATIGVAGLLAGGASSHYLAAGLTLVVLRWAFFLASHHQPTYAFTFDPERPQAKPFLQALRPLLQQTLHTQKPFRLRIHHFRTTPRYTPTLELSQRDLVLTHCVERNAHLNQPGRLIVEHPLPLQLPANRALTLSFRPTADHRLRVATTGPVVCYHPFVVIPLIIITAGACFSDCALLLAISVSALLTSLFK